MILDRQSHAALFNTDVIAFHVFSAQKPHKHQILGNWYIFLNILYLYISTDICVHVGCLYVFLRTQ